MRRTLLCAAALAVSISLAGGGVGAMPLSGITVFGDSLVDSGNAQIGSVLLALPDPTPAAAGYFFGRFSDGPNFADLFALARTGAPMVPFLAGGSSFAVGGARATVNADASPDLIDQLGIWAGVTGGIADPNALYLLTVGGNDLIAINDGVADAPLAGDVGPAIAAAVQALNDAGARQIVVSNIPGSGSNADAVNAALDAALGLLALDPATDLRLFDLRGIFNALVLDPASIGLPPLTLAPSCLEVETPSPTVDCSAYGFFDPIHPTAQVHAAIAAQLVAAVPVPATGLMLLSAVATFAGLRLQRR